MSRQLLYSCLLAVLLLPAWALAEDGQYRSKVLIDPGGALSEGVSQSIEQLEQQLDGISDSYAKASTGRHLARHYVEEKQYDKAIIYYRTALAADGLSDIPNRELLRELAQVYLLSEDYPAAIEALQQVRAFDLAPEPVDNLLLAHAYSKSSDHLAAVTTLDQLQALGLTMDVAQSRQALAIYYKAGAYSQSAKLLRQLLDGDPDSSEYWHQLTAVYLQQDKRVEALNTLSLAHQKQVPFSERDILLLADLYAVSGSPYTAATTLEQALSDQTLAVSGGSYRKLFEYWLHARNRPGAVAALGQAAKLTGDTELYLHLAQLYGEEERWHDMQATVLSACSAELADEFVSRANLLLGISQLKLGDEAGARRSFINATLVGGASAQAAEWLRFMAAAPATPAEARRVVSVCYGGGDRRASIDAVASAERPDDTAGAEAESGTIATKTIPSTLFYTVESRGTPEELAANFLAVATRLAVTLVRAGGDADGPLTMIYQGEPPTAQTETSVLYALPTQGRPRNSGRYRLLSEDAFSCSYMIYRGEVAGLALAWEDLARSTLAAGHTLSGTSRTVFTGERDGDHPVIELQLGIE